MTINVSFFEASHIGKRNYNQDYFAHIITETAACFVVADGLGGHQHGEIASKMLCEALIAEVPNNAAAIYRDKLQGMELFLQKSYEKMKQGIIALHGHMDTHTTFALAWIDDSQLITAHVGDSRIYRVNEKSVLWRTPDHTQVQTLFERGKVAEDEMGKHHLQNQLSRTVNLIEQPDIDIFIHPPLTASETLILCTDGFWTDTPIEEMIRLANAKDTSKVFEERILQLEQHPFADNITIQVIKLPKYC